MKIYITPEAKQMLDLYVDATTEEISGLGKVRKIGRKIMIEQVYLLKQKSSGSSTDLDMDAVSDFLVEMVDKGDGAENLKLWWHSHGNMGAFWSGTDDKTIEGFDNEWMVSLVMNRKDEYKCRLDVYDPVHLVVENAELCISAPSPSEMLMEAVKKEVEEKVKTQKFYNVGAIHHGYGGYGMGYMGEDYRDDRDRNYGPVPSSNSPGAIGVWKKDSMGVWRLSRETDDKEDVSMGNKEKENGKKEGEGKKTWGTIGFRQSEK